jgi:hypothetical protein
VANKILDGPNMVGQLFEERRCIAHQTRHALSQRVIEALEMIGLAACFVIA